MSTPAPETIEREQDKLFVTDAEMIRRLGIPARQARAYLHELDKNPRSGFPRKSQMAGGRRWWPAVRAYFDRMNGLSSSVTIRDTRPY